MPSPRKPMQRSPSKRDLAETMGRLRRSSAGPGVPNIPGGSFVSRSTSDRRSPSKVSIVPTRLVRSNTSGKSNTSANHSISRRRQTMNTPPRKAHPVESRYSNASWKERRQEVEIEEVTSIATPMEPVVTRPTLGALAQSARSSSAQSVLAFVHAASATVAAIKAPASGASSTESKDKVPVVSPPSPVTRRRSISKPLALPTAWCRELQFLLIASNTLCLAVNAVRLWLRTSALHIESFRVIFPTSVLLASDVTRVLGCLLWEFVFASFHSTSLLRGAVSRCIHWRRSNRVVPLDAPPVATTTETLVQRFRSPGKDEETNSSVGFLDTQADSPKTTEANKAASVRPYTWLWAALRLRVKLVDPTARNDETAWTVEALVLLLVHWNIQLCIAATMSSSLPNNLTTLHDFYPTLILLNMWVLPIVKHVLSCRFIMVMAEHFFHLLWIATSLFVTVIGVAVIPLGVFQDQCRSDFDMSTHKFPPSKRLDSEWVARASLALEWFVNSSPGAITLRVIAGMAVIVTIESIHATLLDADFSASGLAQSVRRGSDVRKTSLSSAIPDSVDSVDDNEGSCFASCKRTMFRFATPYRVSAIISLVLGVITIAGASQARSSTMAVPVPCKLELRPWFKSSATCSMLEVTCPFSISSLGEVSPRTLSDVQFLSIHRCHQLDAAAVLAKTPSVTALSLENSAIPTWSPDTLRLSQHSHASLRSVTLLNSQILAPFLDATDPPALLAELLACGASTALPPPTSSQPSPSARGCS